MSVKWTQQSFDQLSTDSLFKILQARQAVFVVEQNCPYPDIDATDTLALHLTAWDYDGEIAGYARIIKPGVTYPQASIGRVLIPAKQRGTGMGRMLMHKAIDLLELQYGKQDIKIGAQHRLEKFYNSLGFESVSESYLEDGIPHIDMLRPAAK